MSNTMKYLLLSVFQIMLICKNIHGTDYFDIRDERVENVTNAILDLESLLKNIVPILDNNKKKGDAGKICVIGGSEEYTGAPYFSAITSLKVGADIVYVISTETAASIIKTYSPELIVYPYLNVENVNKISGLIKRMDVVIIGPGLGRKSSVLSMASEIIEVCRNLKKPLIVDADGLYLVSNNLTLIQNYPNPGVILLPNQVEMERLKLAINKSGIIGFDSLGPFTFVLLKGKIDSFVSHSPKHRWSLEKGGSGRRASGQGDLLAGALGTFFNWALKYNITNNNSHTSAASLATFGAAVLIRGCNEEAFKKHGRSMVASDMINEIHKVFDEHFEK